MSMKEGLPREVGILQVKEKVIIKSAEILPY
jgi:hypothetical protein